MKAKDLQKGDVVNRDSFGAYRVHRVCPGDFQFEYLPYENSQGIKSIAISGLIRKCKRYPYRGIKTVHRDGVQIFPAPQAEKEVD